MRSKIYWINTGQLSGDRMGTMARPRGDDWLEDEVKNLQSQKVDCLISLLESSEEWELGLVKEGEVCMREGIEFINFPIKDVSLPNDEDNFIKLVELLADKIKQNEKVVVHCRMGIGRSSMLVAAVMIRMGYKASETFDIIGEFRKLKVPDTEEQKEWVLSLDDKLSR